MVYCSPPPEGTDLLFFVFMCRWFNQRLGQLYILNVKFLSHLCRNGLQSDWSFQEITFFLWSETFNTMKRLNWCHISKPDYLYFTSQWSTSLHGRVAVKMKNGSLLVQNSSFLQTATQQWQDTTWHWIHSSINIPSFHCRSSRLTCAAE